MRLNSIRSNNNAMLFNMLLAAGFAIVIIFAIFNIGTFYNGKLSSELVDSLPPNARGGSENIVAWSNSSNGTASGWYYRNITLNTTICRLYPTSNSNITIWGTNNNKAIAYELRVNGYLIVNSSITGKGNRSFTLADMLTNLSNSGTATYMNFSWWTDAQENNIRISINATYYRTGDLRTTEQNNTAVQLGTITDSYFQSIDIMIVCVIIMAITLPLAAVVAVKKLF